MVRCAPNFQLVCVGWKWSNQSPFVINYCFMAGLTDCFGVARLCRLCIVCCPVTVFQSGIRHARCEVTGCEFGVCDRLSTISMCFNCFYTYSKYGSLPVTDICLTKW